MCARARLLSNFSNFKLRHTHHDGLSFEFGFYINGPMKHLIDKQSRRIKFRIWFLYKWSNETSDRQTGAAGDRLLAKHLAILLFKKTTSPNMSVWTFILISNFVWFVGKLSEKDPARILFLELLEIS